MKKIIISISILATCVYADLSVEQIQQMVSKIHEKREGIGLDTLDGTKEPFVHIEVEDNETTYVAPEKKENPLVLHAILNNKAFINDAWYSIDETISEYQLKYIGKRGVVLRNESHIKKLFLHDKKENYISIKEKE